MKSQGGWERIYALLAGLFPARLQEEYGQEALELFRDQLEVRRGWKRAEYLMRAYGSLLVHLPLAWMALPPGAPSLRAALRALARRPASTALLVLMLGTGIGGATGVFSIMEASVLAPLPYPEAHRLVRAYETGKEAGGGFHPSSPGNLVDWIGGTESYEAMAGWYAGTRTLRLGEAAEELRVVSATSRFFSVLGVPPDRGTTTLDAGGGRRGVVLSGDAARRLFPSGNAVGTTVHLNDVPHEVMGVMPAGFAYPDADVDAWALWDLVVDYAHLPEVPRDWRFVNVTARLAPGVDEAAAQRELVRLHRVLAQRYPEPNRGWTAAVVGLRSAEVAPTARPLWMALTGAGLILLVALVNMALLLLAQIPGRRSELAVRRALGAEPGALVGLLLAEGATVALLGTVVGIGVGQAVVWGGHHFGAQALGAGPHLSWPAMAFAAAVAGAAALAVFLVPAQAALRTHPTSVLRANDGRVTGGSRSAGEAVVVIQVAAAVLLLGTAVHVGALMSDVLERDPGFDPQGLATFRISLNRAPGEGPASTAAYYREVMAAVAADPAVRAVTAIQTFPLHPVSNDPARPYRLVGTRETSGVAPTAQIRIVGDAYFRTMRTPITGPGFTGSEETGGPAVAVVSAGLASRLWPDGDAIGQSIEVDFQGSWRAHRVVGIAADSRAYGLQSASRDEIYLPHVHYPYLPMNVVVRTERSDPGLEARLAAAVRGIGPGQPIYGFAWADALLRASWSRERLLALALLLFASMALLLTATGVYGMLSLNVNQRRMEMGIRMALGAEGRDVARLVWGRAVILTTVGATVGVVGAWGGARLAERLLADPPHVLPWAGPAAALMMVVVAGVASALPALRAARCAPAEPLRGVEARS